MIKRTSEIEDKLLPSSLDTKLTSNNLVRPRVLVYHSLPDMRNQRNQSTRNHMTEKCDVLIHSTGRLATYQSGSTLLFLKAFTMLLLSHSLPATITWLGVRYYFWPVQLVQAQRNILFLLLSCLPYWSFLSFKDNMNTFRHFSSKSTYLS